MTLEIYNDFARLLIATLNLVALGGLSFWTWRFILGRLRGENGITVALALFFSAAAIDRFILILTALYRIYPEYLIASAILETARLIVVGLFVLSLGFVTWRFASDKDNSGQDSTTSDAKP